MRHNAQSCWLAGLVGAAIFCAIDARAGDTVQANHADELFAQGVRLMKEDRCPEAVPILLRSQRLDSSVSTLVNLGTCYARLGRTATAWRTYLRAVSLADRENDDQAKKQAQRGVELLSTKLTKLTIVPPSGSGSLSLTLNGEPVELHDGDSVPIDPGENIVEVGAPGRIPFRRTIQATELGATIVLDVPELAQLRPKEAPSDWRVPALVLGGAGAATVVTGALLGLSAISSNQESRSECDGNSCTAGGSKLRNDAWTKGTYATITMVLGSAMMGGGLALWLTSPARKEQPRSEPAVRTSIWIDPAEAHRSVGIWVGGAL